MKFGLAFASSVGTDPGSKADQARSRGIPCLDEKAFEELLAGRLPEAE